MTSQVLTTPVIYVMAGQIGSGKTTRARQIAKEKGALFFSIDQWIADLGVPIGSHEEYARYYPGCLSIITNQARQALGLGVSVVFDFGGNGHGPQTWLKALILETGADHEIHHLVVPLEVCRQRVSERNKTRPAGIYSFTLTETEFDFVANKYAPPAFDSHLKIIEINN